MTYYVSLSYATFLIESKDRKIVFAAPIAKWTIGKDEDYVLRYFRRKGARIEEIV